MKQINILRHTPEFILILLLLGFFIIKKPYYEWDRVINSDGKGYYAYLPAIFIYNDLIIYGALLYEIQIKTADAVDPDGCLKIA